VQVWFTLVLLPLLSTCCPLYLGLSVGVLVYLADHEVELGLMYVLNLIKLLTGVKVIELLLD
jgi:hypothetical protein